MLKSCWNLYALHVNIRNRFNLNTRKLSQFTLNDDIFGLTNENKQLRHTVSDFCKKELAEHVNQIDKNNHFPGFKDFFKKCGSLGLLGITVPVQYGGSGATYLDHCIISEEMSRVSAAISFSYGAHSSHCINLILKNGTEQQKLKYLPRLCSGEIIGAVAMSETGSGSDVLAMKTRAQRHGDEGYCLNGTKFWITNGAEADLLVVYAKTESDSAKSGITAFLVEKGMNGFHHGSSLDKMGMRGSTSCELVFDNCVVPAENMLGRENKGVSVLFSGLDFERIICTAASVGIMQACCDAAFDYAHIRETFGQPIGTYQMIQAKMADMYTSLSASKSYLYNVVRLVDKGQIVSKDCLACLLFVGDRTVKAALDTVQILGGNGYINDYPASRFLRDAVVYEIVPGTNEIRRLAIGRTINSEYGLKRNK